MGPAGQEWSNHACKRACRDFEQHCYGVEVSRRQSNGYCELELGPVSYAGTDTLDCSRGSVSCHVRVS